MLKIYQFLLLTLFATGSASADVIAIITGEHEYHTEESLTEFAKTELEPLGHQILYVAAPVADGENTFKNIEALQKADLVILSVRRRAPQKEMLESLRAHLKAGKALIGIRTSSHAFELKKADPPAGHEVWPKFDDEIFGGNYLGHRNNTLPDPIIGMAPESSGHPILAGIEPVEFRSGSSLYQFSDMAADTKILFTGGIEGETKREPVAWTRIVVKSKIFYTSLGGVQDFKLPVFRKILRNAVVWGLEK